MPCILLATDGSENSQRATDYAARLAQAMGLALWVVNIEDHIGIAPAALAAFSSAEHLSGAEIVESMAAQMLEAIKERIEAQTGIEVHVAARKGDVAGEIMAMAREKNAAAIVVGKRGHGRLAGLLIGSVTQKLVSLATCPVIVVP